MRRGHGQRRGQEAILEAQHQQGPGQVGVTGSLGSGSGVRGQVGASAGWAVGRVPTWGGDLGSEDTARGVTGSGGGGVRSGRRRWPTQERA